MLEARKPRISALLQILKKSDTHYRADIQRFKGPSNIQHQKPNNQFEKSTDFDYYIYRDTKKRYE